MNYIWAILWNPENSDTAPYTGVRQNHEGCAILLKKFTPLTVQHSNEKALVTYPTEQGGVEIPLPTNMTQIMEYILNPGRQLFTAISHKYNLLGGFIVNSTTYIVNSTGNAIYSVYNVTNTALNTTVIYVYTTVEETKKIVTHTAKGVLITTGLGMMAYGVNEMYEFSTTIGKKRNVVDMLMGSALAVSGTFLVVKNQ